MNFIHMKSFFVKILHYIFIVTGKSLSYSHVISPDYVEPQNDLLHPLRCAVYPLMAFIKNQVNGLVKSL